MPKKITKVGKYSIIRKIARGGMGAVYLARHPTLKRYVILKQLTLRGGGGFIERFKREASLMIDFRTDHIVPVYDHFKVGSSYYIVMEYVDGISLDKLIDERGYLSNEAALLIFAEICKGLKYAHDKAVIHRDIKPANILISKEGEVKLVDFGIATSKEAEGDGLTKVGMTLGTPSYMSPEQISDTSKVDKRADIYSMGVMFYEMITGTKPFPSSFTAEAIERISKGVYVRPKKINPLIPRTFKSIVKKTMNHKIKKRYNDLQSILNIFSKYTRKYKDQRAINTDIKRYLSGSDITFPSAIRIGKRRYRRGGLLVAVTVGLIILTLLFVGGLYCYYKGYYYEYIRNREFGGLEISASIPKEYFKETRLIYAYARLTYQDYSGTLEEDEIPEYHYRLAPSRDKLLFPIKKMEERGLEEERILTTNVLYLPEGNYNMELYLENKKFFQSFYLNPRVIQKQNLNTASRKLIQFDYIKSDPKPISIAHKVIDSLTGESLYRKTDISFYLKDQDRWIDWKRYNEDERLKRYLRNQLRSGEKYQFKYQAPLYYETDVQFYVESNLDSAKVEVSLLKKPGQLMIESDFEGLEILIDNRKESYLGEREKDFISYGTTVEGVKEFMFPEGNYVVTVKKGKRIIQNSQFKIRSTEYTIVKVSYDDKEKEIKMNVVNPEK